MCLKVASSAGLSVKRTVSKKGHGTGQTRKLREQERRNAGCPHPPPGNQRFFWLWEAGSGKPSPRWRELDNDTSDFQTKERSHAIKVSKGPVTGLGCCDRWGTDTSERCTPL